MKQRLLLGMCWALWLSTSLSFSQTVDIEGNFRGVPFAEFVRNLEAQYDLTFFFDPHWVDSLYVDIPSDTQSVETLLDLAFHGTDLHYTFIEPRQVIVTKGQEVFWLADSYFQQQAPPDTEEPGETLAFLSENTVSQPNLRIDEIPTLRFGEIPASPITGQSSIGGYLRDAQNGEALVGASVYVESLGVGTLTDAFGFYVLTLPWGAHELSFRYVGKEEERRRVLLYDEGNLDVELTEEILSLSEVVISGEKSQVESVQTGSVRLNIEEINTIPTVLGEADVLKISLALPGVQSVGEGSSGFHVRGGTADQNLILLDGAPVYNPNHLFGFFSAFNSYLIKYAELSKSGIKAQYGGRASSVFDIAVRDGNRKKFIAAGGISPLTGKISLEGPLTKDKGSFILGLRSTYANWLLKALDDPELNNSTAYFGDVLAKVQYSFSEKDHLSLSAYHSRDRFRLNEDTLYQYVNTNGAIRWRHVFNNQFSSLVHVGFTQYGYDIESPAVPSNAFTLDYGINQADAKIGFDFFPSSRHHIQFGFQNTWYELSPGKILPLGAESGIRPDILEKERGLESAVYLGDEITLNNRLSLYGGIRFSLFNLLGPNKVFSYAENLPKETNFIVDTLAFSSGEIIKTYAGPEFRFSSRYKLGAQFSVKLSYDRNRQYVHMLTNTVAISPTDTWRLSNTHLRPQISDQVALGFYNETASSGWEFSVESYYKRLRNILEYKDGADLLVNETLEADVLAAKGRAYGVEVLVKKKTGQLNGWVSYTFSRTLIRANSPFKEERINGGAWYPANYDKPHNATLITNYKVNRRVNFSLNATYSTGRPTTVPISQYQFRNNQLAFFSQRNQYRIPDYFRMDFAMNIEGNHKIEKLGHSSWSFSIYNLTGRNNAYSIFSRFQDGAINTYQLSIFARPVFTLTYNFELR